MFGQWGVPGWNFCRSGFSVPIQEGEWFRQLGRDRRLCKGEIPSFPDKRGASKILGPFHRRTKGASEFQNRYP